MRQIDTTLPHKKRHDPKIHLTIISVNLKVEISKNTTDRIFRRFKMIFFAILILFTLSHYSATSNQISNSNEKKIQLLNDRLQLLSHLRELYIDDDKKENIFSDEFWNSLIEKKNRHEYELQTKKNSNFQKFIKTLKLSRSINVRKKD